MNRLSALVALHDGVHNPDQVQRVVNIILIVAAVLLLILAALKLLGEALTVLPRAPWWGCLFAALILLIIWWVW